MRSKTLRPRFSINHVGSSAVFASFEMLKYAPWHAVLALFTANANVLFILKKKAKKKLLCTLDSESNNYIPAEKEVSRIHHVTPSVYPVSAKEHCALKIHCC